MKSLVVQQYFRKAQKIRDVVFADCHILDDLKSSNLEGPNLESPNLGHSK